MNVFCWLGWKQPTSVIRVDADLRAVAEARLRPRPDDPAAASARSAPSHANAPSATITRRPQQCELPLEEWQAGVALLRRRLVPGRRATVHRADVRAASARARRRAPPTSAGSPRRHGCSDANRKSPERSPVNIRPVRFPPCAAGARPRINDRGLRIAEPRHRPAPVRLSAKRATFSRATCSRQATNRGHARHAMTSASIPPSVPVIPEGGTSRPGCRGPRARLP